MIYLRENGLLNINQPAYTYTVDRLKLVLPSDAMCNLYIFLTGLCLSTLEPVKRCNAPTHATRSLDTDKIQLKGRSAGSLGQGAHLSQQVRPCVFLLFLNQLDNIKRALLLLQKVCHHKTESLTRDIFIKLAKRRALI